MKKLLALFLVLTMLVASLAVFSSCDDSIDAEDAQVDPYTTLLKASRNTALNFFFINDDAKEIIKDASKKGAFTLDLSDCELLDDDVEKYTSSFFADAENNVFVSESVFADDNDSYSEISYFADNSLTIKADVLSDKAFKIDLKSMSKDFKASEIAKMIKAEGDQDKDIDQIVKILEKVEKNLILSYEDSIKNANEYLTIFVDDITEAEITIDEDSYDCIKMPVELNKANAKELVEKFFSKFELSENAEAKKYVDEIFEELDDNTTIKMDFYIDTDTTSFVQIDINVEFAIFSIFDGITNKPDVNTVKGSIKFGTDRMIFNGSYTASGSTYNLEGQIVKAVKDDVTTFDYSLSVGYEALTGENGKSKIASGAITCNAKTGDIKLSANVPGMGEASVNMKLVTNDDVLTLTVKSYSLKEGNETNTFDVNAKLTIKANAEAPAAPTGAVEVLKLSEAELKELMEELGGFGMAGEPEIDFDDEFEMDFDDELYEEITDGSETATAANGEF